MARLIHQLHSEDTDEAFSVLRAARERLSQSGSTRLRHTLPPLAFKALELVPRIKAREEAGGDVEANCKTVGFAFRRAVHCDVGPLWAADQRSQPFD